ncbi:MAG: protein-disulfide reductase DsbD [Tatlockia sp.]|nr:protein-disulfide reductase DsbD [Tatlockia sp.]
MKNWFLLTVLSCISQFSLAAPLPAADVFQLETKQVDANNFSINWHIKPGYFLYSKRIKLSENEDSNFALGTLNFPEPHKKIDKQGREFSIYRNNLALRIPVLGQRSGESLINLSYQGCSDEGFCYPPENKQLKLSIDKNLALSEVVLEAEQKKSPNLPKSSTNEISELFNNHHWSFVILSFWVLGLLLSFTPCILPMIPVLSGIIVGHGETLSTRKAFLLSLSYVLSMSFTYAMVGAVVAKLGANLQVLLQTPWAIGLFSFIFVLLALSMFGFFELRLPLSWQVKLAKVNRSQTSGHYISAAIMGCLSTLILSPCVTAPLIGALGYIAQSGNITMGSSALFFLGLGMGTPLLLIGTSAGKWLPKAGKWMNTVKLFFGFLLLGIAVFLLERILPKTLIMLLWASLLVFAGLYCGALKAASTTIAKLGQGLGLMLLLYGLLILIGASMGNTNPLQPLAKFTSTPAQDKATTTYKTVDSLQLALANARGKLVLIDFYADWCHSCQVMAETLFKNPDVLKVLNDFVVLTVDVTANNEQAKLLMNQFGVVAPPTFILLNQEGKEQKNLRLVGDISKNKFLTQLKQAKKSNRT